MATRNTLPPPLILDKDRDSLQALHDYPDYAPHDPSISAPVLIEKQATHERATTESARLRRAYKAARKLEIDAAWDFHDSMVRARAAVVVQFGPDSQAVRAVGYKRKSERKRPAPRKPTVAV